MGPLTRACALVLLTAAALLGCSRGSDGVVEVRLDVRGEEMSFSSERLRVAPGAEVHVVLVNRSRMMRHNWVLANGGEATAKYVALAAYNAGAVAEFLPPDDQAVLAATPMGEPGAAVEVRFTAPSRPGFYYYLCTIPGHLEAGMWGILEVAGSVTTLAAGRR